MDDRRFDVLARTLVTPRSRRGLVKTIAGAALAVVAGHRADPALATGTCDLDLAAKCVRQADDIFQQEMSDCRDRARPSPANPRPDPGIYLSCVAGATLEYNREMAQCTYQPCDASSCQTCVNGSCQSICPAGISCVGGQCAGCPGSQHKCGTDCCLSDQACCSGACCPPGITSCNPDGSCGCPSGEKPCQGGCIPAGQCCASADCPPNTVCQGGVCQQIGCRPAGETCGRDAECCSGLCLSNACAITTTTTAPPTTTTTTTTASPTTTTTTAPPGTCSGCTHWDDCPGGGTCSSCALIGSPNGQCQTVVCGGVTCPKPTVANHRAVCCNGQCDLACFATVGFNSQGPQCCEGYNVFGGPPECQQPVACQGSAAACNGTCTS